jgi:hypothetical protein
MSNETQENFKEKLFKNLNDINISLNEGKELSQKEMTTLLMASILEEEG